MPNFTDWVDADAVHAILRGEIELAGDVRLDVSRRHARGGLALGLDFLLNVLIVHAAPKEKSPLRLVAGRAIDGVNHQGDN